MFILFQFSKYKFKKSIDNSLCYSVKTQNSVERGIVIIIRKKNII